MSSGFRLPLFLFYNCFRSLFSTKGCRGWQCLDSKREEKRATEKREVDHSGAGWFDRIEAAAETLVQNGDGEAERLYREPTGRNRISADGSLAYGIAISVVGNGETLCWKPSVPTSGTPSVRVPGRTKESYYRHLSLVAFELENAP